MNSYWLGVAITGAFFAVALALGNAYRISRLAIDLDYVKREAEEAKRAAYDAQQQARDVADTSGLKWQAPQRGRWVKP